jgi:hypothetical protein
VRAALDAGAEDGDTPGVAARQERRRERRDRRGADLRDRGGVEDRDQPSVDAVVE